MSRLFHYTSVNGLRGIIDVQGGIAWFDHTQHVLAGGQKLWAEGAEGWLAHVSGDLLYIKQFPPIDAASAATGPAIGRVTPVPSRASTTTSAVLTASPIAAASVSTVSS